MKETTAGVRVFADRDEVARAGAEELLSTVAGATPERPRRILLSGGTTPEPMYRILASEPMKSRIDWSSIEFYIGDERPVPPDHPESNFGLAYRALLEPLGLLAPRTYRIRGEASDLELAARRYEALIRARFAAASPADPAFDLVYLGLGEDGHTASLFPGVQIPDDPPRLVVAVWIEALQGMRATVTYRLLNAARRIVFLVAGQEKAAAVQRTLAPSEGEETPAARVSPAHGEAIWLLDRNAASRLPRAALERERG
ncbi:MAG TPA: 6-phosphogluconolactonase [Candidatus Eisenbacteria bacterium]|jgi:6-phosphogluconolactonase